MSYSSQFLTKQKQIQVWQLQYLSGIYEYIYMYIYIYIYMLYECELECMLYECELECMLYECELECMLYECELECMLYEHDSMLCSISMIYDVTVTVIA